LKIILWHIIWTPNLHYFESRHGRYGAGKEGANQENLDEDDFMETKFISPKEDLVQGKAEHAPRLPKGINTTPLVLKEG
jgi:hypothetical protein